MPKLGPPPDDARRIMRARVLDPEGNPVAGAIVSARSVHQGDRGMFGRIDGLDPYAVSDTKGVFRVCHKEPADRIGVHIGAPGLAPKMVQLATGGAVADVKLDAGATVSGRLLLDDKPLPGIGVGLVQTNRGTGAFYGEMVIATDAEGRFTFRNVPTGFDWVVYGKMEGLRAFGATVPKRIRVDGAEVDAGDLAVDVGHKVRGRVVLADGADLPKGVRVLLSADLAWDTAVAVLDDKGRFEMDGIPPGLYSLNVRIRGYRLSARNVSRRPSWPSSLDGRVDADLKLVIEMEPGRAEPPRGFDRKLFDLEQQLKKEPIRGVVAKPAKGAGPPKKK